MDFVLQEEYILSWEQGQVTAQLLNVKTPNLPVDVWGAFLDLTPVDPQNTDLALTDYPMWSVHIDYNGSINQSVPEGTFRVDLVSHGNPMKLDQDSKLIWTVKKGEINNFGVLKVKLQKRYSVSGKLTNENGDPVWAEVLFVDPNDEYNYYWPEWEPVDDYNPLTGDWIEPEPGTYSVRIPEGTYKILAREHSGLFSDSYYNGTNFSDAQEVTINDDLRDINFILKEGAVSTFTIRLENKDEAPITGAWFHFYDGDNEYGGLSFPQVQEDGLGNYTLKIRPGVYKIQVEGPGYQSFFRIKDDLGNSSWESSFWEKAEAITANASETQDLGTVSLEEYEHDFGWTPPFWFEEEIPDVPFQSNTISGEVLTDKGAKVPGARIFAHTKDYLIWVEFDQYGQELKSRPDGSYKIENLPDGEWVVFAVPPTESDDYLGLAESDRERKPIGVKNGESKTQNLILRGANVSGRIMYPEKTPTGVRSVSLADAEIWVYSANAQGLPAYEDNWFFEEDSTFIEQYAVTDDKGFFSLNLPQAGSYAISIFLPQRLSALSTKPIEFRLEDPNKPVKIGNSIRLEWPSQGASKKIDISRKIKDAVESPTSVLEKKLVANTTYYVDTITPGKDYEYKVEAISEDEKKNTVQDVRTSPPIIFLSSPSNTVTGTVLDTNDREISGAEVEAWRLDGEGWASTSTGTDGTFEFSLGAGEWEIFIYRPYGKNVSWIYEGSPRVVTLTEDTNRELKEPFVVSILSEVRKGSVTGKINFSDFNSSADLTELIFIDAYDPSGRGDSVNPDKDGNFAVYLNPGEYEVSVWVDPSLGGFADYEPEIKRVGKGAIDIGQINFIKFSSTISGQILADNGNPIFGAEVWAWSYEGGWASTTTGRDGSYSLSVSPGRWEVGYDFLYTQGQIVPYIVQPPKRVRIKGEGESKIINFTAKDAGAVVKGLVTEGGRKANINGWVYAKKYEENSYFTEVLAEVPLSNGEFSFPAYEGSYLVGLWLPPGSDYDFPDEKLFHVEIDANGTAILKDENKKVITQAVFEISSISSSLSGKFKDSQGTLTGLSGEVYAMRTNGSGWRSTEFTNGTYSMSLPEGNWLVDYFITQDDGNNSYPSYPAQPFRVTVNKDTTYNFDLSDVEVISASISGTVRDETGSALKDSMVYVWAFREENYKFSEFWNEVQTDEDGNFSIPVLPGGRYEVGIFLPEDMREKGYLDAPIQFFRLKKDENATGVVFDLIMPAEDNYIEGLVVDENENPLEGAYIYAWNHDGLEIDTISDEKGKFKLNTSSGSIWRVGGDYSDYNSTFLIADREIDVDLRNAKSKSDIEIILKQPDFVLPDSISENFDPKVDFYKQLPDGTEITIPAGTLQGIEEIKLVVTPTARIARDADVKTADYAYSLELFNAKTGKKIEGGFEHDVIISVPVDIKSLEDNGVDLDTIEGKYYDATKNAWVSAKTTSFDENSSKLVMTTDHFSSYVVASQSNDSDLVGESLSYTETDNAEEWYSSDWFGPFYNAADNWIYHYQLGWLFTEKLSDGSYWLYHEKLEWLWTSSEFFDYESSTKSHLFSESKGAWLFYNHSNGTDLFWEYSKDSKDWITP